MRGGTAGGHENVSRNLFSSQVYSAPSAQVLATQLFVRMEFQLHLCGGGTWTTTPDDSSALCLTAGCLPRRESRDTVQKVHATRPLVPVSCA